MFNSRKNHEQGASRRETGAVHPRAARIGAPRWLKMTSLACLLAFAAGIETAGAQTLGKATFTAQPSCPAGSELLTGVTTTCYQVSIQSCPGGSPFIAWLKMAKLPSGKPKGTILFTTGTTGIPWYDQNFVFGSFIVNAVVQAGYAAAQISFTDYSDNVKEASGWLTVLDGTNQGPGNLACRFATLADSYLADASYPGGNLAATGNSAGGALIAYALARYGLGTKPVLTLAEITSGPPLARIDTGCLCNQAPTITPAGQGFVSQCYFGDGASVIDPTYAATPRACAGAETSHTQPPGVNFLADSIVNGSEFTSYPETTVNVIFGGQDNGPTVPNAIHWASSSVISAKKLSITWISDAPHSLPDNFVAAQQVITDLTSF